MVWRRDLECIFGVHDTFGVALFDILKYRMRDPACAGSYGAASLPSQGYGPTSRGCGIACGREALSPRLQVGNGSLTRLNSLKLASCRLLKFFFGERR